MSKNPSPNSPSRDSNAGTGDAFDQAADTDHRQTFTDHALAADQLPTAGHDQQPPETPARFAYPFVRGRAAG